MTMLEARTPTHQAHRDWVEICPARALEPGRGVCALVGGAQVAIFLMPTGEVHAIGNRDPFSRANVLSRGLTGSAGDLVTVASPIFKHRFDLRSGRCLDDPSVRVPVFDVRVCEGIVAVQLGAAPATRQGAGTGLMPG